MNNVFLLTGGNLGNRLENLNRAKELISKKCGDVVKYSSIYETAAWGFTNQPDFYNQVLAIQTLLEPDNLMLALLDIEKLLGRKRDAKMGLRMIDIDILLTNSNVYNSSTVIIPHPHIAERRFVLTPLAEIAGEIIHPVFNKTINELLIECKDELPAHKISTDN